MQIENLRKTLGHWYDRKGMAGMVQAVHEATPEAVAMLANVVLSSLLEALPESSPDALLARQALDSGTTGLYSERRDRERWTELVDRLTQVLVSWFEQGPKLAGALSPDELRPLGPMGMLAAAAHTLEEALKAYPGAVVSTATDEDAMVMALGRLRSALQIWHDGLGQDGADGAIQGLSDLGMVDQAARVLGKLLHESTAEYRRMQRRIASLEGERDALKGQLELAMEAVRERETGLNAELKAALERLCDAVEGAVGPATARALDAIALADVAAGLLRERTNSGELLDAEVWACSDRVKVRALFSGGRRAALEVYLSHPEARELASKLGLAVAVFQPSMGDGR